MQARSDQVRWVPIEDIDEDGTAEECPDGAVLLLQSVIFMNSAINMELWYGRNLCLPATATPTMQTT